MAPNALYLSKVFPLTNCELGESTSHSLFFFFFAQSKLVVSYQKILNELELMQCVIPEDYVNQCNIMRTC